MTHTTRISSVAVFDPEMYIGDKLAEDRFFHAFLALKSQEVLAIEDGKETPSRMKTKATRSQAVAEWSRAVANGFVCC